MSLRKELAAENCMLQAAYLSAFKTLRQYVAQGHLQMIEHSARVLISIQDEIDENDKKITKMRADERACAAVSMTLSG